MGKIFCLIGKSSSGKDTIFKKLREDKYLDLKAVISYTTRPKRNNENNGVEYYFIDEETLESYKEMNRIIELREYSTVNGKWYYCTVDDGQIDLEKYNYLIIVTLEAYKSLQHYFNEDTVIPLYISVDDGVRLTRALNREMQQQHPNYDELCRRFLADNNDFSADKLNNCGIKHFYDNYNFDECIYEIKKEILKFL